MARRMESYLDEASSTAARRLHVESLDDDARWSISDKWSVGLDLVVVVDVLRQRSVSRGPSPAAVAAGRVGKVCNSYLAGNTTSS